MNSGKKISFFILLLSLPLIKSFGQNVTKDDNSGDGDKRYFYAGILTGVTFDNYAINISNDEFQSFSDPSPFMGISLKFLNPKKGPGFLLQSAFAFKEHHYSYRVKNSVSNDYFDTNLKSLANITRIGMTLFRHKETHLAPFAEAGMITSIYLNQKYENFRNQVSDYTIFTFYNHDKENSSFYYGAFIQAGLMFNINNGNKLIISGGYDYMMGFNSERIQSCDLSINYILKFRK